MDLTGLPIYAKVMEGLFPDLCNATKLPRLMQEKVASGTKFYAYKNGEEETWEEVWTDFTHDIRKLVEKYEKKIKL